MSSSTHAMPKPRAFGELQSCRIRSIVGSFGVGERAPPFQVSHLSGRLASSWNAVLGARSGVRLPASIAPIETSHEPRRSHHPTLGPAIDHSIRSKRTHDEK